VLDKTRHRKKTVLRDEKFGYIHPSAVADKSSEISEMIFTKELFACRLCF
jgi:hypothetical protein